MKILFFLFLSIGIHVISFTSVSAQIKRLDSCVVSLPNKARIYDAFYADNRYYFLDDIKQIITVVHDCIDTKMYIINLESKGKYAVNKMIVFNGKIWGIQKNYNDLLLFNMNGTFLEKIRIKSPKYKKSKYSLLSDINLENKNLILTFPYQRTTNSDAIIDARIIIVDPETKKTIHQEFIANYDAKYSAIIKGTSKLYPSYFYQNNNHEKLTIINPLFLD